MTGSAKKTYLTSVQKAANDLANQVALEAKYPVFLHLQYFIRFNSNVAYVCVWCIQQTIKAGARINYRPPSISRIAPQLDQLVVEVKCLLLRSLKIICYFISSGKVCDNCCPDTSQLLDGAYYRRLLAPSRSSWGLL